jgi:hypothetical protein
LRQDQRTEDSARADRTEQDAVESGVAAEKLPGDDRQ